MSSITFTNSSYNGISGTLSWSHTLDPDDDFLLVCVGLEDDGGDSIDGLTAAGTSLTCAGSASGGDLKLAMYYLLETSLPSPGSVTLVCSTAEAATGLIANAVSGYNLEQQAPEAIASSSATTTATITTSITTVTSNAHLFDIVAGAYMGADFVEHTGQSAFLSLDNRSGFSYGSSEKQETEPGVETLGWTANGGVLPQLAQFVASFASTGASSGGGDPGGGSGAGDPPYYPFPQQLDFVSNTLRVSSYSQAQMDTDIENYYDQWKTDFLIDVGTYAGYKMYRVALSKTGADNDITVSEGQGYGMTVLPIMAGYDANAQDIFDGLYRFVRNYPSSVNSYNMAWRIDHPSAPTGDDTDSAFDGDMHIAYGLLRAHAQWGSSGEINYLTEGVTAANAILDSEIGDDSDYPLLGDWVDQDGATYNQWTTRPSDFSFIIFKTFEEYTENSRWGDVYDACIDVLDTLVTDHSPSYALIPDFVIPTSGTLDTTPKPAGAGFLEGPSDGFFYYNSFRVPLRTGLISTLEEEPILASHCTLISEFMRSECSGNPSNLNVGYELDGTGIETYSSIVQTAPIAVATMKNTSQQAWLDALYDEIRTTHEDYFEDTVCLLSMLALAGNHWIPGIVQTLTDYYGASARIATGDASGDAATFTFTIEREATKIDVFAQWPTGPYATDTPFTITAQGTGNTLAVDVDQSTRGGQVNYIGGINGRILAGDITVVIDDDANGTVVADMVRIEVTYATPPKSDLELLDSIAPERQYMRRLVD